MPESPPGDGLTYWHGRMDARLSAVDEAIKRLDVSMDGVKKEIVESNVRMARYMGGIAVVLGIVTMLAPIVMKFLFGAKP